MIIKRLNAMSDLGQKYAKISEVFKLRMINKAIAVLYIINS